MDVNNILRVLVYPYGEVACIHSLNAKSIENFKIIISIKRLIGYSVMLDNVKGNKKVIIWEACHETFMFI
mgnify:CR=1 FL=1